MTSFIRQPYGWAKIYSVILTAAFALSLLDAFVIPKSYAVLEEAPANAAEGSKLEAAPAIPPEAALEGLEPQAATDSGVAQGTAAAAVEPVVTENSYTDEHIQIVIETAEEYNTTFYVADIQISDPAYLKTALAQETYGRNIKAATSEMAAEHNAILAINGDYYGFRDTGYVLRNGVLYRDVGSGDALVIDNDGQFSIVEQSAVSTEVIANAWQILSFGPALVENGEVVVDAATEVTGKSSDSNPRTAIGQAEDGRYIIIVSDGRTGDDAGLSLLELANEFAKRGAVTAYNLDGGGSSTLVFNGTVVNTTTNGRSNGEREVSDIVYIGYE